MKNIILLLALSVTLFSTAQSTYSIQKPLRLETVTEGTKSDSVLVRGADKIVKFVPRSRFSSETSKIPNLNDVLTAGPYSDNPNFIINSTYGQFSITSSGINLGTFNLSMNIWGNKTINGSNYITGETIFDAPVKFINYIALQQTASEIDPVIAFKTLSGFPDAHKGQLTYSDGSGFAMNSNDGKRITIASSATNSTSGLRLDAGGWGTIIMNNNSFEISGNAHPVNIIGEAQLNGVNLATINSFKTINGESILGSGDLVIGGSEKGLQSVLDISTTATVSENVSITSPKITLSSVGVDSPNSIIINDNSDGSGGKIKIYSQSAGVDIIGAGQGITLTSDLRINLDSPIHIKEYTVATLPLTPLVSTFAVVTDALSPAYLSIVVGGGSQKIPVFYNGTNWVCH